MKSSIEIIDAFIYTFLSVLKLHTIIYSMNRETIKTLDSQNMLGSIEVFQDQCREAWESSKQLEFPETYKDIENIVFFGMGGSSLGIDVIQKLFAQELRVPVTVVGDYIVPGSINEKTLVIFSSYSGTTEEVLSAYQQMHGQTEKIFIISTGGDLEKIAREQNIPAYIFQPTFNPSNQPRMASGYSIVGILGLFVKLGLLSVTDEDITALYTSIQKLHVRFGADVDVASNFAKQTAVALTGSIPLFISSEFLEGAVHVATNQMNENSKTLALRLPIPEMNHHFIEAFVFPKELFSKIYLVYFESDFYHERNQKRYRVTEALAKTKGLQVTRIHMQGKTKMEQAFEAIVFGSYLSFYLAMQLGIDPSPIPNVDHLKVELAK